MARKIIFNGNSRVIKRLCERVNDDSLEKIVITLQETVFNLISDIYGAVVWITETNDELVTDEGDYLMFITGEGNISNRLSALEALDYLTYNEDVPELGGESSGE